MALKNTNLNKFAFNASKRLVLNLAQLFQQIVYYVTAGNYYLQEDQLISVSHYFISK